jgi:hypothetical protein
MAATFRLKQTPEASQWQLKSITPQISLVTCLDEKADIRVHESNGHSDSASVGQNCTAIGSALFDETEDVVPSNRKKYQQTYKEN